MLMFTKNHETQIQNLKALHQMELQMVANANSFEKSSHATELANLTRLHALEITTFQRLVEDMHEELKTLREKVKPRELEPESSVPLNDGEKNFSHDQINKRVQMWTDANTSPSSWEGEGITLWANQE